jgi:hypothetical protein
LLVESMDKENLRGVEEVVFVLNILRDTLIKKKIKFPYKEIQNGAVAKSYMTNGLLIYREIFGHFLIY